MKNRVTQSAGTASFAFLLPRWIQRQAVVSNLALVFSVAIITAAAGFPQQNGAGTAQTTPNTASQTQDNLEQRVVKTDKEWRRQLSALEYYVTRQKGTERAFTGKYWNQKKPGIYTCKCCGQPLFDSKTKFKSGTGWPSYFQPIKPDAVRNVADYSAGMIRTEVVCSRCDAHLGHVFNDGPRPTGLRYCMNSVSLDFEPAKQVIYGHRTRDKLVEALKVAADEHSIEKAMQCLCWDRLPGSIKQQMQSSTDKFMPRKVKSMTIEAPESPASETEDFEYNVKFLGNIKIEFEDGSEPALWPYGKFKGRFYLATALERGTLKKIEDGTIDTEPELPKFKSLQGSGSR